MYIDKAFYVLFSFTTVSFMLLFFVLISSFTQSVTERIKHACHTHCKKVVVCVVQKMCISVLNAAFSFAEVHFGSINLLKEKGGGVGLTNTLFSSLKGQLKRRDRD